MGSNIKEQELILKNIESFKLEHIFECGQCFRWNKQSDGSYIGVIHEGVLQLRSENKGNSSNIIIKGKCDGNIKEVAENYFDLKTDYKKIKEELSKIDEYVKNSIEFGNGIRILNQDLWEMVISFIISANNNIPRIKGIIERLSRAYGEEITFDGKNYYKFPTPQQLSKATVKDLRELGLGFRDQRVHDTTHIILNGQLNLDELSKKDTQAVREELLTLPGVGPKVADCIMLFGLHRFEVFPIDVWVRRVMNELYLKKEDENKVDKKEIEELAKQKYRELAGLAQQYLFYWKREMSN